MTYEKLMLTGDYQRGNGRCNTPTNKTDGGDNTSTNATTGVTETAIEKAEREINEKRNGE